MNLSKIISYYAATGYANLEYLKAAAGYEPEYNSIPRRVKSLLADEAAGGVDYRTGRTYGVSLRNMDDDTERFDERGEREYEQLRMNFPLRVYNWVRAQLHEPETYGGVYAALKEAHPGHDVWNVHAMQYPAKNSAEKAVGVLAFGIDDDFAVLRRGLRSYQRKLDKAAKKVLAQLAVYHKEAVAAKEMEKLRTGHWLGAEKALTTTPRVDEPRVPFLGDAKVTPEQLQHLRYWAVPQDAGMSAAFPAGTGIALKVITASNQLVNGAVYLWQAEFGTRGEAGYHVRMSLGRLDTTRKEGRGWIPLFSDDNPTQDLCCEAQWTKKPGRRWEATLMQVVYYTTRAEQLAPALKPASTQPLLRVQGREQSFAQAA